ncbi:MAG TPA: LLM class flavin-dependent oxidoreductase [Anaerolineaceae bacterium]|nr:LLM class flavin-dependent oxidoreductase [Anaerolineaceae bacterium]
MAYHPIQCGYFLTPTAAEYPELVAQAQLCDRLGLDLIGIQDHPYQYRFLDTWTLISVLAAQTERVRFFPDVANLPLRLPSVLAKSAASLDVITGGRIELGLGAGTFWQAVRAMGGPMRKPGEAVEALEEALQIIRLVWSGQHGARFDGQHYSLHGANTGPVPAHPMQIWIGATGPRMLALTGRLGDGWIPSSAYVPPEKLPALNRRIDAAAAKAGRHPGQIRRLYNVSGRITTGERGGYLEGPADYWAAELRRLADECGMDSFIFAPQTPGEEQIRRFAEEVAPRLRG